MAEVWMQVGGGGRSEAEGGARERACRMAADWLWLVPRQDPGWQNNRRSATSSTGERAVGVYHAYTLQQRKE